MPSFELMEFCRIVRQRSAENAKAMLALSDIPSQQVSVLRQELDSMFRVIWMTTRNDLERQRLAEVFTSDGRFLDPNGKRITDFCMANVARLHYGWVSRIYDFGCKFIHLTKAHDYVNRDPLSDITVAERNEIRTFFHVFHGAVLSENFTYMDVVPLIPSIFAKLQSNLKYELSKLEKS